MSLSYSQIHKKAQEAQAKQQQLQDAKIPGFFIPEAAKEWRELSRRATCNNIFRLNEGAIQSGSKATDTQFVCYRALCERLKSREAFVGQRARFGITNDIWEAAGKFLAECDELQLFLDLIEKQIAVQSLTHKDDEWPRSWVLPKLSTEHITSTVNRSTRQENDEALQQERQQMAESIRTQFRNLFSEEGTTSSSTMEVRSSSAGGRRVRSTPGTAFQVHTETTTPATSKAEFPDAFDETVVNTYIVQLLELLSLILNHYLAGWTIDRIKLQAWFNEKTYTAYTDGALQEKGDAFIQGSIEVKKGIREPNILATTKQEISQVVAMVQQEHPAIYNGHWLVVGQDRHEIYLHFSHCSEQYLNYIRKGDTRKTAFLETETYGPWCIDKRASIQDIMQTLLALTLIANLAAAEECLREVPRERKRQRRQ